MARWQGRLPVAALRFTQRFFRGAQHFTASERVALHQTLRAIEAAPELPAPEDVATVIPLSMRAWRRRVAASDRYVYFVVRPDGVVDIVGAGGLI